VFSAGAPSFASKPPGAECLIGHVRQLVDQATLSVVALRVVDDELPDGGLGDGQGG